jgi:uncharacterized protein YndB with AHSA1/START domain
LADAERHPSGGRRPLTFQAEAEAGGGPIECEVLAVEPLRLLRYSWRGDDDNRDASERALDST